MPLKVFVLGIPGSGKSTVFRHIENYVKQQHEKPIMRICDYEILYSMYLKDKEKNDKERQFSPTGKNDGFDIRDFSVLDISLNRIHEDAKELIRTSTKKDLIVIEFARNDYKQAFRHFNSSFFHNAYILFLDVDKQTCMRRVNERVLHWKTLDDHDVSEYIFNTYYNEDSKHYIISGFREDYELEEDRIMILDNRGSEKDFVPAINQFIDFIIMREENKPNDTKPL